MKNIRTDLIHPSWDGFFSPDIMALLAHIDQEISTPCNPVPENVLRFAQQPLDKVKVLILGQDTYPAPGVATGRAFEVGGLIDWNSPFRQISLKHIIQCLYGTYTAGSPYVPFSRIIKSFPIMAPDKLFDNWARQGVLLLNAALTCEYNKPGAHSELWAPFTEKLLLFIDQARPGLPVFLWGSTAQKFSPLLKTAKVYQCRHPMMCSEKFPDDFLKFQGFRETANIINWLGDGRLT